MGFCWMNEWYVCEWSFSLTFSKYYHVDWLDSCPPSPTLLLPPPTMEPHPPKGWHYYLPFIMDNLDQLKNNKLAFPLVQEYWRVFSFVFLSWYMLKWRTFIDIVIKYTMKWQSHAHLDLYRVVNVGQRI